jgi:N-methylhydantoinase A
MAGAIRRVSIEEGADPREATLVAFGGAGGLHATAVARRLGMAGVVVPLHAGVFSALGLLMSPPRIDVTHGVRLDAAAAGRLAGAADAVADEGTRRFADVIGGRPETVVVRLDARYVGQAHELSIPWRPGDDWEAVARRFDAEHLERNGFSRTGDPVEIVTFRSEATGKSAVTAADLPLPVPTGPVSAGRRPVRVATGTVDAEVIRRQGLAPGDEVVGPAVVEESDATTFIGPGERARVHDRGALVVEW